MIHFGRRAFELAQLAARHGLDDLQRLDLHQCRRRRIFAASSSTPRGGRSSSPAARTRCFEGRAVNGGVIVASHERDPSSDALRWVENHGRPPSGPRRRLGARPSRPSRPHAGGRVRAVGCPSSRTTCACRTAPSSARAARRAHSSALSSRARPGRSCHVGMLIQAATGRCSRRRRGSTRWKERPAVVPASTMDLPERDGFVLLGLVIEGGVRGLQTADDRRFLAAIEGTEEAERGRRPPSEHFVAAGARQRNGAGAISYRERRGRGAQHARRRCST